MKTEMAAAKINKIFASMGHVDWLIVPLRFLFNMYISFRSIENLKALI